MFVNISNFTVHQNVIIASEWFQIGAFCKFTDSRETKAQKKALAIYQKYEQDALNYNQQLAYENGMVSL